MSKNKYILNPYLPEYEYIPDGEPHVFGDRIYIYGSHDRFDGTKFCMNDYVCYSAPLDDLTDWRYEGVIYRRDQDPRTTNGDYQIWAPDVVQGKDGRYYLYYCPDDRIWAIGVAVCDTPAGKYEFLGVVQDKDGNYIGERPGDVIAFDPGVFIDDDGKIYLFSGNAAKVPADIGKFPKGSRVMELEDDMYTIKTEPKKLLPGLGEAEGTTFEGHEFFEASSIRKINGIYYLVYSSVALHELCYATSTKPDEGYVYGGVLISNADIFEKSEDKTPKNCFGNDHGGIECVKGQYYIFYHRHTNQSHFSRQAGAEKIYFNEDGSINQAELTSCGLNDGPLPGEGIYPASCVCELYGKYRPVISKPEPMNNMHPYLTQDGPDFDPDCWKENPDAAAPRQFITNCQNGFTALFRYFDMDTVSEMAVTVRGMAVGRLKVYNDLAAEPIGEFQLQPSGKWKNFYCEVEMPDGTQPVYFKFEGRGHFDLLEFELIPEEEEDEIILG